MKEKLKINNFGPIKEACIEVNKYTIFIGESSSGKSIIMKILAFCKWLQKEAVLADIFNNTLKSYKDLENIGFLNKSELIEFINADTKIYYESPFFTITITQSIKITTIKDANFLEKVSFISDDRFIIPIFMQGAQVDGLVPFYAKNIYREFSTAFNNIEYLSSSVLGYEINKKKNKDGISRIFIKKNDKEVGYYNASSGIKSLSVIEIILTNILKSEKIINHEIIKYFLLNNIFSKKFEKSTDLNDKYSLFLEEPELSLFPKHQFELMKYLIEQANKKNDLNYVFSTHSPYIISALNNLIKASEIIKKFPEKTDKVREIIKTNALINIDEINAYLVKDGYVNNIIDNEFGIITADSIDDVGECLSLMYEDLLEILHEDF